MDDGAIIQYDQGNEWAAYCNTIMAEPLPVNIGLGTNYDSATEEISITVEIYYPQDMTDANHVYVMLAEPRPATAGSNVTPVTPVPEYVPPNGDPPARAKSVL